MLEAIGFGPCLNGNRSRGTGAAFLSFGAARASFDALGALMPLSDDFRFFPSVTFGAKAINSSSLNPLSSSAASSAVKNKPASFCFSWAATPAFLNAAYLDVHAASDYVREHAPPFKAGHIYQTKFQRARRYKRALAENSVYKRQGCGAGATMDGCWIKPHFECSNGSIFFVLVASQSVLSPKNTKLYKILPVLSHVPTSVTFVGL